MYESILLILEDLKQDILDQYEQLDIKASGKFEKSMVIGRRGRSQVYLSMAGYSAYFSKLRGTPIGFKGWFPPQEALIQWIKDKGLQLRDFSTGRFKAKTETNYRQAAYLIGRKIRDEGTDIYQGKREPIDLDAIINDRLDYRMKDLADRILQDLKV